MSEINRDELQSDVGSHIEDMNSAFLAIFDLMEDTIPQIESKEDAIFLGNGLESVYQLLDQYRGKLDTLYFKVKDVYRSKESEEMAHAAFEQDVLSSLDKLPMTDAYDVR